MPQTELTPKQRAFKDEYIVDLNGTQAAIRAGYSVRTAKFQASRLLTKANVAVAIQEAFKDRAERTEITQDRTIQEIALLAFSNIGDVLSWDRDGVTLKGSDDLPEDVLRSIAEITDVVTKDGKRTLKVKLYDKKGALELVGRHLGLFVDRSEVDVTHHKESEQDSFTLEELRAWLADLERARFLLQEQNAREQRALTEPPALEGQFAEVSD